MANIKSQKKRIITNEKARMRNRAVKSELKTATRRVKDAVAAGNGAEAYAAALAACRLMDKAASKGVIHKNQAANRKSGIMLLIKDVVTDAARDARKCLLLLGRMESVSPHALLAMCTTRLRELVCARALADRGNPRGVAAALKIPDWRCKNHAAWARGFTAAELRRAIVSARDTERAMKSGADAQAAFLDWVLSVTAR